MEHFGAPVLDGMLATAILSEETHLCEVAPLQAWRRTDFAKARGTCLPAVEIVQGVAQLVHLRHIAAPSYDAAFHATSWPAHESRPFVVSPGTTRLVRAGFDTMRSEIHRALWGTPDLPETVGPMRPVDDAWLRGFVSDRLVGMLATVADVFGAYGVTRHALVGARGISEEIEPLLQNRIPCVARRFPELSASVGLDVRTSLVRPERLQFGWGSLAIERGVVIMSIDRPVPAKPRLGQPVRRVE